MSGFAHGVDTEDHRGALEGLGPTEAVLGSGVDVIYPRRSSELADKVLIAGGAIISEHPPGTEPLPRHFPRRNRVISWLSMGGGGSRSGAQKWSLITAKTALEQGREVFAVPGLAGSSSSEGTHNLLRQGTVLAESAIDILHEIERSNALVGALCKVGFAHQNSEAEGPDEAATAQGSLTAATEMATVFTPAAEVEPKLETTKEAPLSLTAAVQAVTVSTSVAGDVASMLEALEEAPLDIETLIKRSGLTASAASAALMELVLIGRVQ